jgi:hypothetical protein
LFFRYDGGIGLQHGLPMFSRAQDISASVRDPADLLHCSETGMATMNSNRQKQFRPFSHKMSSRPK